MFNRTHLLLAAALSCAVAVPVIAAETKEVSGGPKPSVALLHAKGDAKLTVTSPSFESGSTLADAFSQKGQNKSPALNWTSGPTGTRSYVVLAEDTGVKRAEPISHWVIFDIPATATMLPEGLGREAKIVSPMGAVQGKNSNNTVGYTGPNPPSGKTHPYHFEVFALDTKLDLDAAKADRKAVFDAMNGHVLAQGEIVVKYTGKKNTAKS